MSMNPLTLRYSDPMPRPAVITFDIYGTLARWDETAADALRRWGMLTLAAFTVGFLLIPHVVQAQHFDYEKKFGNYYIQGWFESSYSVFCGLSTKKNSSDTGYTSLYRHAYWLQGEPQ